MTAIDVKNLTKKYGKFTAVNDISFSIAEGELFALLGENGAGKTTTIKVLTTLLDYERGEIFLFNKNLKDNAEEIKKLINISPQETAVAGNLTVKENLNLICNLYALDNAEEKINKTIDKFSLTEVIHKRAKTLSGGYQRRLSIAMALITEPKILFLDEPTLGLDVRARRELWKIIGELKGKMTIILTTHYIEEAEALSDKMAIMKNGKIVIISTAEELKAKTGEQNIEDAFIKITEN